MKRKAWVVIALVLVLLAGCSRAESRTAARELYVPEVTSVPEPPVRNYADLTEVLAHVTQEVAVFRLSSDAESNRRIQYVLTSFNSREVAPFVEWLREECRQAPDVLVMTVDANGPLVLNQPENMAAPSSDTLFESLWRQYTLQVLEYDAENPGRYVIEVGVLFPPQSLIGSGVAYVLEKTGGQWEIVDSYETWIS